MAFRVPTLMSAVDLTVKVAKETSYEEIMLCWKMLQKQQWKVLGFTEDLVVSQDFVGDSRTSIIDANGGMVWILLSSKLSGMITNMVIQVN
jgi:glyceraldehyde 3-phosphate dehydrogenase